MFSLIIGILPPQYFIPTALLLLSALFIMGCCSCWQCHRNSYKNAAQFSGMLCKNIFHILLVYFLIDINIALSLNATFLDDHSDVNVKIETLVGDQFFSDMYNSISNESHRLLCSEVSLWFEKKKKTFPIFSIYYIAFKKSQEKCKLFFIQESDYITF